MKKLSLLLASAALLLFGAHPLTAQELVTTGVVQEVVPQKGMLTVRSDQTNAPISFSGLSATNIFTVDGSPAQLVDLTTGTKVTVQYATRGNVMYVSKIMFGQSGPAASSTGSAAPSMPASGGVVPRSGSNPTGYPDQTGGVAPVNNGGRRQ